ncbi:uncharacterized protein LOC144422167 [Styela clava]
MELKKGEVILSFTTVLVLVADLTVLSSACNKPETTVDIMLGKESTKQCTEQNSDESPAPLSSLSSLQFDGRKIYFGLILTVGVLIVSTVLECKHTLRGYSYKIAGNKIENFRTRKWEFAFYLGKFIVNLFCLFWPLGTPYVQPL